MASDGGAGEEREAEHDVEAEDVEEGQHAERDVVGRLRAARGGPGTAARLASRLPCVSIAAFGRAGGAAREDEDGEVVVGPLDDRHGRAGQAVVEQQRRRRARPAGWRSRARAPAARPGRRWPSVPMPFGPGDHRAGADRRPSSRVTSGARAAGVDRHGHAPGAEHGEVRHDEVPVVGHDDRDAVARLEAQPDEPAPQAGDLLAQLAVGRGAAARDQRDRVGGVGLDDRRQVHRAAVQHTEWAVRPIKPVPGRPPMSGA